MFRLLSRLVCTASGFVYPTYASYKAIKSNDLPKLEVWLMYWTVMGTVMALESTVEWIFDWFPFYYEFKTIVILWLTLPQIQGSTYIYVAHLHPFLSSHETDIDAALADAKVRAKQVGLEWLNKAVQRLRQAVIGSLAPQLLEDQAATASADGRHLATNGQLATEQATAGATSQLYFLAGNVLRTYGPAAVAAGSALLHPMNGRAQTIRHPPPSPGSALPSPDRRPSPSDKPDERIRKDSFASGRSVSLTTPSLRSRRAELEAQLAEIDSSSPLSASSPSSATSTPSSLGGGNGINYQPRTYHPRSVSAGPYPASLSVGGGLDRSRAASQYDLPIPRDPVASRIERSLYGFEEIQSDEFGDYPPVSTAAMDPGQLSPGGTRRATWWWWGNGQTAEGSYQAVTLEEKDA